MPPVHEVEVSPVSPDVLAPLLLPDRARALLALADKGPAVLDGRTIWNVSSTAAGGGVAEMLHRFVRYVRGADLDFYLLVNEGETAIETHVRVPVRGRSEWFDAWSGRFSPAAAERTGTRSGRSSR